MSETPKSPSVPLRRQRESSEASASWLSAMLLFGPLALLAEFLIERTHHRPLGAATFASLAVIVWIGAEITTRRFLDASSCEKRARSRKILWIASAVMSLAVVSRGFL